MSDIPDNSKQSLINTISPPPNRVCFTEVLLSRIEARVAVLGIRFQNAKPVVSFLKMSTLFVLYLRQLGKSKLPKPLGKYLLCLTFNLRWFVHLVWPSLQALWSISQNIQVVFFHKSRLKLMSSVQN